MIISLVAALYFFPPVADASAPGQVRRVAVEGDLRLTTISILRQISTAPGSRFDSAKSREDLRRLFRLDL